MLLLLLSKMKYNFEDLYLNIKQCVLILLKRAPQRQTGPACLYEVILNRARPQPQASELIGS